MQSPNNVINSREISIREIYFNLKSVCKFILSKKIKIFIVGLLGAVIGLIYAWLTPVKYISRITFVVEESKGVGGGLSALAGQFGFDLGTGSGGGVLAGDNIILFLKSESLCREALLTSYDDEQKITLADKYAEVLKLKKKWAKENENRVVYFSKYVNQSMPRVEDSLLQYLIKKRILRNDLSVNKPDKKASFIQVNVSSQDEKFSALFSQRLVEIASKRYVDSKTKLKASNVALLQMRADSLASILNDKTYRAASSQQILVDVNPALKTSSINPEITSREKTMIAAIFSEVVKNLELAKSILSQETPSIMLIDKSSYPLEIEKRGKGVSSLLWALIFISFYSFYILLVKYLKSVR